MTKPCFIKEFQKMKKRKQNQIKPRNDKRIPKTNKISFWLLNYFSSEENILNQSTKQFSVKKVKEYQMRNII